MVERKVQRDACSGSAAPRHAAARQLLRGTGSVQVYGGDDVPTRGLRADHGEEGPRASASAAWDPGRSRAGAICRSALESGDDCGHKYLKDGAAPGNMVVRREGTMHAPGIRPSVQRERGDRRDRPVRKMKVEAPEARGGLMQALAAILATWPVLMLILRTRPRQSVSLAERERLATPAREGRPSTKIERAARHGSSWGGVTERLYQLVGRVLSPRTWQIRRAVRSSIATEESYTLQPLVDGKTVWVRRDRGTTGTSSSDPFLTLPTQSSTRPRHSRLGPPPSPPPRGERGRRISASVLSNKCRSR